MSKFIYVFTKEAHDDMVKRGYELMKEDRENGLWIFLNNDPDNLEFSSEYQVVLSNVIPL